MRTLIAAAWRGRLMGELQGWLKAHEVSPEQITLRLIRESAAEPGAFPSGPAVAEHSVGNTRRLSH